MFNKAVTYFLLTVLYVSTKSEQGCQNQPNIRIKRGKYYSSPPIRFYNHPPMIVPIKGPFSYTPPPFVANDDSQYPGSRPYKVSKRPVPFYNDGLGDEDIANIFKYMSKQDLDKILEYAQGRDKYKDIYNTNENTLPYKRENKNPSKGNGHSKYEEPTSHKEDLQQFFNHITEPTNANFLNVPENKNPKEHRLQFQYTPVTQKTINELDNLSSSQDNINSQVSSNFPINNNYEMFSKVYDAKESERLVSQIVTERYTPQDHQYNQAEDNLKESHPFFTEINEEVKLPLPVNMREEDYEASYTNNVAKVEKPDSYDVQNFGELPLMDYNSKLHDVSSYHVPHYTVTQSKSQNRKAPSVLVSSSLSASYSSSPLLKPSPAAADILEPVYEPAPSKSAAAEQSDAHLKAIKIWSYKSRGAAYTLHDDGSLSPENNKPTYG